MGKRRRLQNGDDVRRYLADIALRLDAGELAPDVAGKLGYLMGIMLKAIDTGNIEARLDALEQGLESRQH